MDPYLKNVLHTAPAYQMSWPRPRVVVAVAVVVVGVVVVAVLVGSTPKRNGH